MKWLTQAKIIEHQSNRCHWPGPRITARQDFRICHSKDLWWYQLVVYHYQLKRKLERFTNCKSIIENQTWHVKYYTFWNKQNPFSPSRQPHEPSDSMVTPVTFWSCIGFTYTPWPYGLLLLISHSVQAKLCIHVLFTYQKHVHCTSYKPNLAHACYSSIVLLTIASEWEM